MISSPSPKKLTPNWYVIVTMTIVHLIALYALTQFTWRGFTALMILYPLTAFGITFGFHRLFTHRAFKTSKPVEYAVAVLGSLTMQGNLVTWVAHHRMHHAGSDTEHDPHNANRGFWFSHFSWMLSWHPEFDNPARIRRYARDLINDRFFRFLGHDLTALLLQGVFGFFLWSVWGLDVMLWGVFVRLVVVYHVTWFVNSACHKWGYKNHNTAGDLSTNCWWVGLLALGEGWHNNHHAEPQLAYHGRRPWEFDITGLVIRFLKLCGIVWDVRETVRKPAIATIKNEQPATSLAAT